MCGSGFRETSSFLALEKQSSFAMCLRGALNCKEIGSSHV